MVNLSEIRKEKLRAEIETSRKIKEKGIHPLDILDDLIEELIKLMEIGIKKKYPHATEKEMLNLMRQQVLINEKYKINKKGQ